MTKYTGFAGTYTKGSSKGIYTFSLDTDKGLLTGGELAAELGSPTYLNMDSSREYLYAVDKEDSRGGISVYRVDPSGSLSFINKQISDSGSPCHVSISRSSEYAVTANYHNGRIELYEIHDGAVTPIVSASQHEGSGPNKERQEGPHAHFSGFTPDEQFIVAVDLGTDEIITYSYKGGSLQIEQVFAVKPGSGPRHIEFHPNGRFAYVMTELSNEVIALSYDSATGAFTLIDTISAIPEDFTENSQGSAIHLSADGRFVYAGNRGHNSIAVFSVNEDGTLSLVERTDSGGDWPRDFSLDPSGKFIVGSNQESGNLVLYARDGETGKLTKLESEIEVPYPVCVKFL